VNFLLGHVQVVRPHPTAFRTEGVTLVGDEDSPLCSRISKPAGLPPISEMSKMGLVHMRALSSKFHSNDSGDGLEMENFVNVMSEVLPGMSHEELEAQFMKVDANSDGSVSWDEFSNYILAAGNASDANSSKQEGGALLEGPEPDLNKDVMHGAPMTHLCCHEGAERYISIALEDRGSVTRPPQSMIRMWNSRPDCCGEYLVPMRALVGVSAHVMCACVFEAKFEWRTGPPVNVLAVASVDGHIRFFDLEKISLVGELDLLNAVCTCMSSFSIRRMDGVDGEHHILAWGDDKGRLRLVTQEVLMDSFRRGTYVTASLAFVEMDISEQWLTSLLWLDDMELLVVADQAGMIKVVEGREPPQQLGGSARRPMSLLTHERGAKLHVASTMSSMHSLAVKALCWCIGSKVTASAGLDRTIFLWDPLTTRIFGSVLSFSTWLPNTRSSSSSSSSTRPLSKC